MKIAKSTLTKSQCLHKHFGVYKSRNDTQKPTRSFQCLLTTKLK